MVTIVVYSLLLIALTPPLGAYMYRDLHRGTDGRVEGVFYRILGVNPEAEQSWRRYATSVLWFSLISMVLVYLVMRWQQHLPLNPDGLRRGQPVPVVQHRRQLHDQHELAVLRRRDDDELPHADVRAHVPELRVGGRRHGRADRDDPRLHARRHRQRRQLLARPGAQRASTSCCRWPCSSRSC